MHKMMWPISVILICLSPMAASAQSSQRMAQASCSPAEVNRCNNWASEINRKVAYCNAQPPAQRAVCAPQLEAERQNWHNACSRCR